MVYSQEKVIILAFGYTMLYYLNCDYIYFSSYIYWYVALAVYTRSPSAYEALHKLKIFQLPHSKTLKKVIRGGSEQSGIDEDYLQGQQQIYEHFQSGREAEGHPRPLGIGVLMWDEVKVWRTAICF